ncbi:MAG: BLUF domain-containing protein [Rariglobus sp.]
MSELYQIIYASAATKPFDAEELGKLLEQSQRNNQRAGITGLLLYHEDNFLQVLEGEKTALEILEERIRADPRHHGYLRLLKQKIEEREFPEWAMALRDITLVVDPQFGPMSDYLKTGFHDETINQSSKAQTLLRTFRKVSNLTTIPFVRK